MDMERKRLHVSSLPPDTKEEKLIKKLKRYFNVSSVEIKHRPDGYSFAFVDVEETPKKLEQSLKEADVTWKGYKLKLQLAKESFLQRLQKEIQESSLPENNKTTQNEFKGIVNKSCSPEKKKCLRSSDDLSEETNKTKLHHDDEKLSSTDDSSDSEESNDGKIKYNKKLPMFCGTKFYLNNQSKYESVAGNSNHEDTSPLKEDNVSKSTLTLCHEDRKRSNGDIQSDVLSKKSKFSEGIGMLNCDISEKKRLESIKEKQKQYMEQKRAIKLGLSFNNDTQKINKRIVFDENDDEDDDGSYNGGKTLPDKQKNKSKEHTKNKQSALSLFDGKSDDEDNSDDDDDDFKIKIRKQFEGEKGQKLLELQSKYANDQRFALDERFYESENDDNINSDKKEGHDDDDDDDDERLKALKVLESVLGTEVVTKDVKKSNHITLQNMLRYDPTRPDHKIYELKKEEVQKVTKEVKTKKKTNVESNNEENINYEQSAPVVSKERYYFISDTLKESLHHKEFSLLQMFGEPEEKVEIPTETEKPITGKTTKWSSNPFKYDSSDSENEDNEGNKLAKVSSVENRETVCTETLFFKQNDKRFTEGVEFINHRNEDYFAKFSTLRIELKGITKYKMKNNIRNKKDIKRKLGGQKKKERTTIVGVKNKFAKRNKR